MQSTQPSRSPLPDAINLPAMTLLTSIIPSTYVPLRIKDKLNRIKLHDTDINSKQIYEDLLSFAGNIRFDNGDILVR